MWEGVEQVFLKYCFGMVDTLRLIPDGVPGLLVALGIVGAICLAQTVAPILTAVIFILTLVIPVAVSFSCMWVAYLQTRNPKD
jgi:hypothetical protein